jgi:hypothetical protein
MARQLAASGLSDIYLLMLTLHGSETGELPGALSHW